MIEHPGQIEIWKKIVDVQQHFNDLELRIRNLALVVTGAFLGLGGYAIKDAPSVLLAGVDISLPGIVVLFAAFPLAAFYFMDRFWYHRLLVGAVEAGVDAETALRDLGYKIDLGGKISAASPFEIRFFGARKMRSKDKMDVFYGILLTSIIFLAAALQFGTASQGGAGPHPGQTNSQPCPKH